MAERLLLNGVTRSERQETISSVSQALQESGGWIDDVHFFSNVAVNLRCVIPVAGVDVLVDRLGELPLGMNRDDVAALTRAAFCISDGQGLRFSLQITFVHDEPDLRRHVPSVPG